MNTPNVPGYSELEPIGEGGYGSVFSAIEDKTQKRVALKIIDDSGDSPQRFDREKNALRLLNRSSHPNVVGLHDFGMESVPKWLAMDLMYSSLRDELARHPGGIIPQKLAVKWVGEAGDGLAHVHEQNILHRDIKPGNILLTKDGVAKLGDFGLATSVSPEDLELTGADQRLGTPVYNPPEPQRTRQSDIFSLAATFFNCVEGSFATAGASTDSCTRMSHEVATVITRALEVDPQKRPQAAQEFVDELRRAQDRSESQTTPSSSSRVEPIPERQHKAPSRRRRLAIGAITIALALVPAGAFIRNLTNGESGDSASPAGQPTIASVALAQRTPIQTPEPASDGSASADSSPTPEEGIAMAVITEPTDGATVEHSFVVRGTASDPVGVGHIELALTDLERGTHWNPSKEVWQQDFRLMIVEVEPPGGTSVTWETELGIPLPLLAGEYRVQAWARSVTSRGDPISSRVEVTVADSAPLQGVNAIRAESLQTNPILDPVLDAMESGEVPEITNHFPKDGVVVYDGFRVQSRANFDSGMQSLDLILRNEETGEYWDFDAKQWSSEPKQGSVTPAANVAPEALLILNTWIPPGSTPPGKYSLFARATPKDEAVDSVEYLSRFEVRPVP